MTITRPAVVVEIALGASYDTLSPTWTDITSYVDWSERLTIVSGRSAEREQADANRLSLTLKNSDGRFTPANTAGAYYPNVRKGTPIRVRATWNSVTYERFRGYVDEWPLRWENDATFDATVRITASSNLARLGRSATLRSIVEEEFLYDDPFYYWPLGDPEGTTDAAEITGTSVPLRVMQMGEGGTLEFGAGTGPSGDSLTAPLFTRAGATSGKYLAADVTVEPDTGVRVEMCFTANTQAFDRQLFELWEPSYLIGDNEYVGLWGKIQSDGTLYLGVTFPFGGIYSAGAAVQTSTTFDDEEVHSVVFQAYETSATTFALRISWDGTTTTASTSFSGTLPPLLSRFNVGAIASPGGTQGVLFTGGSISHVALGGDIDSDTRVRHGEAVHTGFAGELPGDRIARYARLGGITNLAGTLEGVTYGVPLAHADTTGKSPLEMIRLVEATDQGFLHDTGDGLLDYWFGAERYNATITHTFDAETHDVGSMEPTLDDFGMANDVTATTPDVGEQRWLDASSISTYGPYVTSIETLASTQADAQAIAQWIVSRAAEPQVRIPIVSTELLSATSDTAKVAGVLALRLGHQIRIENLPAQAPASSMDVFIEGMTEDIGTDAWIVAFNLSQAIASVWELDDTTYSVLDTTTRLAL